MDSEAKLTVLIPLKVSEEMNVELILAAGGERKRQSFIRAGIPLLLERAKEERNGKLTREEIKTVLEAKRLHLDPIAVLRERIAQVSL